MMKLFKYFFTILTASLLFLTGCGGSEGIPDLSSKTGSLVIGLSYDAYADTSENTRSILPDLDMVVSSYAVKGVGPGGVTFEETVSGNTLSVDSLAFGDWTITVSALNSENTIIADGSSAVTVYVGQTSSVDVTVTPLDGYGSLELSLAWNGEDTQSPSVSSSLTPYAGSAYDLGFTITDGESAAYDSTADTATFPDGIGTGYYTLALKLYDGTDSNTLCMGAVEVVRIVKDQTTAGSFEFDEINSGSGSIAVNINQNMEEPLTVTLSGTQESISEGSSITVAASVADSSPALDGNATYVWYINGESVDTGESATLGSDLAIGVYRLDVVAYSADGTRAGSTTAQFYVVEAVTVAVTGIALSKSETEIAVTNLETLSAAITPANASNQNVSWTSSDTDVATVSEAGTVTAVSVGSATITATTEDGGFTETCAVTITAGSTSADDFISTWQIDSDSLTLRFPIASDGTYSATIDWGDGNTEELAPDSSSTSYMSHTYTSAGTYNVTVSGTCEGFGYSTSLHGLSGYGTLTDISQFGDMKFHNNFYQFYYCTSLTGFSATDTPDLSNVTNMYYMFANATAFNSDLSSWDVSNVTNMGYMFGGATSFNQDISGWDVSNVTDMSYMFAQATVFNGDLSSWDVSNVTDMSYMFLNAKAFNGDISGWDINNVTDMTNMFNGATAFNSDLSSWNVSSITNMNAMFAQATVFNGDISSWDVSSVTNMQYMFSNAKAFNGDISGWDVSSVTNMSNMFYGTSAFNQSLSSWNVSNVTDMSYMFFAATLFNGDISGWDVSNVTSMTSMFNYASVFNRDLSSWDVSSVTVYTDAFTGSAMESLTDQWPAFN
jgi:surface protein